MKPILGIAVFAMFCTTAGAQLRLTDGTYTVVKEVRSGKPTWTVIYSGHSASAYGSESPRLKYTLQFSENCRFKSPEEYDCDHPLIVGEIFGNHHFQPSGSLSGTMVSLDDDLGELTLIEFKGEGRSRDIRHYYKILRVETMSGDLVTTPAETKQSQPSVKDTSDVEQRSSSQRATVRKDIPAIAKAANGAIVTIVMANDDKPIALGTGFLVGSGGVIVTNYHVIQRGNSAAIKFPDGTVVPVDGVLAADKVRDLAIVKVHGKTFHTLTLGNSDDVQVGEEVVAIGNPLSLESTVSNGIVSGVRTDKEAGGEFLQITAPITHGSSGGPLFNMTGEVVGVTTLGIEGAGNLNFAIPVNDAKRLLETYSSKIKDFPNEPEPTKSVKRAGAEDAPPSASDAAGNSTSIARSYYQQLFDAGGFSKGVPNAVCFSDDPHSGTFFTFVAYAYDKDYYDAQAKVQALHPVPTDPDIATPEMMTQFDIMAKVQKTAPYVSFLMKVWLESFSPNVQQFFRSGGRLLEEDIYDKGVKTNTLEYRWDGSSWFISVSPIDPKAYSRTSKILRMSIEPTTMRYVESTTVTMTVGWGDVAASETNQYGPWAGACEKVPNPK